MSQHEKNGCPVPDRRKGDEQMLKDAAKQAIKEFLNEKFAEFGRWSFFSLMALAVAGLVYFILWTQGWIKVPT